MPKPKQSTLDELKTWEPSYNDFSYGRVLMINEDCSRVIHRYAVNPEGMFSPENILFCELVYVVLSLREKFHINKQQFYDFLDNNLGTVNNVLKNRERLENLLYPYGMGQKKIDTIMSISSKWKSLDITNKMREDVDKIHGPELRSEITRTIHGVGFKFASLFLRMCGYEDIAPPDTWGINFCESRGYVYKRSDSGLKEKEGIAYEKILKKYAKQYDVSPALFQATIYATWSTWKKDAGVEPWILQHV